MTNQYPGSEYPYQNQQPAQPPYEAPPSYGAPTPGYNAPPPPPSYGAPTPGYGAPMPGYGAPMAAGYAAPVSAGNSGLALASMIVALVSICIGGGIGGVVAVILGHMALRQINASGGTLGGHGQAMAGLIIGYILIGLTIIGIIFYAVILSQAAAGLPQQ